MNIKNTLLHRAVWKGDKEKVKFLLKNGANVNAKNLLGDTPLHYAAETHLELVKLLIAFNASINAKNLLGETPLHYAAYQNKLDIMDYLIDKGTLTTEKNKKGHTPIDYLYLPTRIKKLLVNNPKIIKILNMLQNCTSLSSH